MKVRRETAIIMETVIRIIIKRIMDPTITLTMDLLNQAIPDQIVYRTIKPLTELVKGHIPEPIPDQIMQQIPELPIEPTIKLLTEPTQEPILFIELMTALRNQQTTDL